MADAHRAAIVLAVSALDAFIRMFVLAKIRELLTDQNKILSDTLTKKITTYIRPEDLLEAARKNDLLDRVEKAFRNELEKISFQGTKKISECISWVGYKDIFHDIALKAKVNEDSLKTNLDEFTQRRHTIAHNGDYDLSQNPPVENVITKTHVEDCIKLVEKIANHINEIGKSK